MEYVGNAVKGEKKGKVDDALRNYYWAYTMLKTLQHPSEMKYSDYDGEHVLVSWIPEKINEIFGDIRPSIVARNGSDIELFISFRDQPVTSLDYTYFDGSRWSNVYSAKDGKGVLELAPGALGENIQIKYEYAYKWEAHIDKELYDVINVVKGGSFKGAYVTLTSRVDKVAAKKVEDIDLMNATEKSSSLARLPDDSFIRETMASIIEDIRHKTYDTVKDFFTPDGLDMYKRLISYGKATIIGEPTYTVYKNGDHVVVRSIPMAFSFSRGIKKSFVEDVVFTFNNSGQIECLAFALDAPAVKDILGKQAWPEGARVSIIEFLENYKTAFALERLDYIKTIFDDDAVIIVGKVAKRVEKASDEGQGISYKNNQIVIRTRYSKAQYLKHLEACFASNEFVNIKFANNDVIKAGKGGEVYGIQIKQDYYSINYGDSGYLFLLVDINKPDEPIIKVRTWQPEPDPVDGLFDISHF